MAELTVGKPGDVVTGADVNIFRAELVVQLGSDSIGFGYLLGLKALPLQHVHKIGVATKVELIGSLKLDATVSEQSGKHPMGNSGTHLGFDIIPNNRKSLFGKASLPVFFPGDKYRNAVDKSAAGFQHLLHIPLGRFFTTHG